jgi:hypothetical protein
MGSTRKRQRIAYCECGARLAGESAQELFAAAERHIACRHPHWVTERKDSSLSDLMPDLDGGGRAPAGLQTVSRARGDVARLRPTA